MAQKPTTDGEALDLTTIVAEGDTALTEPVKITLNDTTSTRSGYVRELEVSGEAPENELPDGINTRTLCAPAVCKRQKTQMVFETLAECLSFHLVADSAAYKSQAHQPTAERVNSEMRIGLAANGYRVGDVSFWNATVEPIPEAEGDAPDGLSFDVGEQVTLTEAAGLGNRTWVVEAVSATHALVSLRRFHGHQIEWVPIDQVEPRGPTPAEKRAEHDREAVMADMLDHARETCERVWPGGTVDPDEMTWFWWHAPGSNTYGRCWKRAYASSADSHGAIYEGPRSKPAIGLNWWVYVKYGPDRVKQTVRHELIHAWENLHPDAGRPGHRAQFKQWLPDMGLKVQRAIEAEH